MNSGTSPQADQYYGYGFGSIPSPSVKEIRKMRRTQLSRGKKFSPSVKNISRQRESSLSNNPKSKNLIVNTTSILKTEIASCLKNSQSNYGQNNPPSSSNVQGLPNPSIRKSRLQISTGVIGIKMDSVSPTNVVSRPSKLLIMNESSSRKKGGKSKTQKSIVYVEYNNFMTELNGNKLSKNQDEKSSQKNTHVNSETSMQILSPQNKSNGQQFSNLLTSNLDNDYFAGMSRNCISPVLGLMNKKRTKQKSERKGFVQLNNNSNIKSTDAEWIQSPINEGSKLKLSKNDTAKVQAQKNQTSIANLSISSTTKNKLQNSRFGSVSPRLFKIERYGPEGKLNKNKISMQDIATLKQKNNSQNTRSNNKIRDSRDSVHSCRSKKKQSYGIQVNISENLFSKNLNGLPLTHLQNTKEQYFNKPIKEVTALQKNSKLRDLPNQKQYKTQKQISLSRGKKQDKAQSQNVFNPLKTNSGFQNPYNLTKNENIVNNYQKKKNQPQFNQLINEIRNKNINYQISYSPIAQFNIQDPAQLQGNLCCNDSQSDISRSSSKRGRKPIKINGEKNLQSPNSKLSIKSYSKSKLNIPQSPKTTKQLKFQPKTPQPYSNYKDSSSSNQGKKNPRNQAKIEPQNNLNQYQKVYNDFQSKAQNVNDNQNEIKHIEEYNLAYYTPNPYSLGESRQIKKDKNVSFYPEDNDQNQIISQLSSQNASLQRQEFQSEVSSMHSIEDNMSIKSGKLSNVSEARLKRQKIANKSKIRSSRNSLKSNQARSGKKLTLNPVSRLDSSLTNSVLSETRHNNLSLRLSKNQQRNNVNGKELIQDQEDKKGEQKYRFTTYEGVKFLKVSKRDGDSKQSRYNQSAIETEKQPNIKSSHMSMKKSVTKVSHMEQAHSINQQQGLKSNIQNESNMMNNQHKKISQFNSVFKTNQPNQKKEESFQMPAKQKDEQPQQISSMLDQRNSTNLNQQQMRVSHYKEELDTKNFDYEIQHSASYKSSNIKATNKFKVNPKQSMFKQNTQLSEESQSEEQSIKKSKTTQNEKPSLDKDSQLQRSAYSINSVQRSGKRSSIKKSIHSPNLHTQKSQIKTVNNCRSSISIKQARNLKPLSIQNPTIDQFLAYVEQYDITVGFLYLYVENTVAFYLTQDIEEGIPKVQQFKNKVKNVKSKRYQQKYEKLAFLVMKKYLYEKNHIIKCLRGIQSNVFNLTGMQIPDKILKKFINHQQTKQKLKQFELQTRQLFKQMEQMFRSLRLKTENKKDKLIKLQTPYDDFTRYIVSILMQELNQITTEIDDLEVETGSKLSSSNPSLPLGTKYIGPKSLTSVIAQQILTSEQRGVEVMEIVFLLSELQGRKVKRSELFNKSDIDFEVFYENYIDKLLLTYDYFEALKYPSDRVDVNKKIK